MISYSRIEWLVYNDPIPLLDIKSPKLLAAIDSYLPYSTGTEIECEWPPHYNSSSFLEIPDLMELKSDKFEQRFRIPNGLKGLVCLFRICEQCKLNLELNDLSGIHHHVDFTELYDLANEMSLGKLKYDLLKENKDWYLKELDTWDYKGKYNARPNWIRWNSLKTLEFRCANMTFDYNVMVKRIIHANDITRRLKEDLMRQNPEKKLIELRNEMQGLKKLEASNPIPLFNLTKGEFDDDKKIIKSRTIKI